MKFQGCDALVCMYSNEGSFGGRPNGVLREFANGEMLQCHRAILSFPARGNVNEKRKSKSEMKKKLIKWSNLLTRLRHAARLHLISISLTRCSGDNTVISTVLVSFPFHLYESLSAPKKNRVDPAGKILEEIRLEILISLTVNFSLSLPTRSSSIRIPYTRNKVEPKKKSVQENRQKWEKWKMKQMEEMLKRRRRGRWKHLCQWCDLDPWKNCVFIVQKVIYSDTRP